MTENRKISIVIAAFNEEGAIGDIVKRALNIRNVKEVIVVDDGSTDKTAEIAKASGATILCNPYNIGNGASVRTGSEYATGEIVVLMDGDGQHDPADIEKLIEHIDKYDMVVAGRTKKYASNFVRRLGNEVLTKIATIIAGKKIEDLTSGFRAIKKDVLKKFTHLFPNGFSYPTTITMALMTSGHTVKYVMIDSINKRKEGKSSINVIKDGIFFFMTILRIIILFDPLKIFLGPSMFIMLFGTAWAIANIIFKGGIKATAIISVIVGIFIFFFGLLADQISHIRRELRR